ncbi:MAG: hypothetical protein WC614_08335 [bacterium]
MAGGDFGLGNLECGVTDWGCVQPQLSWTSWSPAERDTQHSWIRNSNGIAKEFLSNL